MNEEYDVIICGTGLKECILSGLLSVAGKKVLHIDRNDYYGADEASLNLQQLFRKFEDGDAKIAEDELGRSKDYSVDLCPKFIMANGDLVKMLLHTKVTRYLEFKCVDGSYVYKDGGLYEVPVTPQAALSSSLMGMFQKRRFKNFLNFAMDFKRDDRNTWSGQPMDRQCMREVYTYWKCDENTMAFTGHAICLYPDDSYLDDVTETFNCLERIQLYAFSLARYEKSPYIYPLWGLGGLPEGFSRLCAVYGGTFMLRTGPDRFLFNDNGECTGIEVNGEQATCNMVIADPHYFETTDKVRRTGQVARLLCILGHPVPSTNNAESAQIIIPAKQTGRPTDIYISVMSNGLSVAPQNRWVAMVSSLVYTDNPRQELEVAYQLLGPVLKEFFYLTDSYVANNDPIQDKVFICSSPDATTHFGSTTEEVKALYRMMMGEDLVLDTNPEAVGTDEQYS